MNKDKEFEAWKKEKLDYIDGLCNPKVGDLVEVMIDYAYTAGANKGVKDSVKNMKKLLEEYNG